MSCYACSAEFGIFRKEVGCEICGFSFCGKCCRKQAISSENGESKKQLICAQCFLKKTNDKSSCENISPPLAHKKRMAALKKQSISVDSSSHAYLRSQWSDDKDKEIAERLQKLKRDRIKDLPSENEIEERIAKLKGMDPAKYKAPPIEVFLPSDRRTSIEKASDLMKEMSEKVELESKMMKPEDEIAARLAKLRADDDTTEEKKTLYENVEMKDNSNEEKRVSGNPVVCESVSEEDEVKLLLEKFKSPQFSKEEPPQDVEMSEEEEAQKLVEKFMAAKFDEKMEELDSLNDPETEKSSDEQSQSPEEFPWCIICSEDAKIRCFGCESDLYCLRCFRECHDSLEIRDHKTCPFLSSKTSLV